MKVSIGILQMMNIIGQFIFYFIQIKEKFVRFMEYFENPFTMKEAAQNLNIKYDTIKKLVQILENKSIKRIGMRDGLMPFKRIEEPINNSNEAQFQFNFFTP